MVRKNPHTVCVVFDFWKIVCTTHPRTNLTLAWQIFYLRHLRKTILATECISDSYVALYSWKIVWKFSSFRKCMKQKSWFRRNIALQISVINDLNFVKTRWHTSITVEKLSHAVSQQFHNLTWWVIKIPEYSILFWEIKWKENIS